VRLAIGLVAIAVLLSSGCEALGVGGPSGGPYPDACADLGFGARRCAAIVDRAMDDAGIDKASVAAIEMLAPTPPPLPDGVVRLGGPMVALIRFSFADSPSVTQQVWCKTGIGDDLACNDDPQIQLWDGIDHDVTCPGEAPDPASCGTLPPTPPQAAIAAAHPLHVVALDVPLDHTGKYAVKVGRATLPNGYLSRREFKLSDTRPTSFWITGGIRLDVRPTLAGRPRVGNIHRDGFDGPEPVDVFLVFEVTETSPGAILQVRDLTVQ
jgi:hypothetical protein